MILPVFEKQTNTHLDSQVTLQVSKVFAKTFMQWIETETEISKKNSWERNTFEKEVSWKLTPGITSFDTRSNDFQSSFLLTRDSFLRKKEEYYFFKKKMRKENNRHDDDEDKKGWKFHGLLPQDSPFGSSFKQMIDSSDFWFCVFSLWSSTKFIIISSIILS